MNRLLRVATAAALIAAASFGGSATAGPFEDGTAALERGDYETAMRLWRPLAKKGFAGAQYGLGIMYADGEGVPTDYGAALSWFRKAADEGNAGAQVALAVMYANGKGVTKDYAAALGWFRKAADQNNPSAEFGLGVMYQNGQGVVQDARTAAGWYLHAADQGNATAQYALGILATRAKACRRIWSARICGSIWRLLAVTSSKRRFQRPML